MGDWPLYCAITSSNFKYWRKFSTYVFKRKLLLIVDMVPLIIQEVKCYMIKMILSLPSAVTSLWSTTLHRNQNIDHIAYRSLFHSLTLSLSLSFSLSLSLSLSFSLYVLSIKMEFSVCLCPSPSPSPSVSVWVHACIHAYMLDHVVCMSLHYGQMAWWTVIWNFASMILDNLANCSPWRNIKLVPLVGKMELKLSTQRAYRNNGPCWRHNFTKQEHQPHFLLFFFPSFSSPPPPLLGGGGGGGGGGAPLFSYFLPFLSFFSHILN